MIETKVEYKMDDDEFRAIISFKKSDVFPDVKRITVADSEKEVKKAIENFAKLLSLIFENKFAICSRRKPTTLTLSKNKISCATISIDL